MESFALAGGEVVLICRLLFVSRWVFRGNRGRIPRMVRARVKARRDFKTPVKGFFIVVLMVFSFVLACELLMGLLKFLVSLRSVIG